MLERRLDEGIKVRERDAFEPVLGYHVVADELGKGIRLFSTSSKKRRGAYVSIRQHSVYLSTQYTSALSIRQHSTYVSTQHTTALSIRQHSAYVSNQHTSAISIRQHSAYVSTQHTSALRIRQHSAYVSTYALKVLTTSAPCHQPHQL